MNLRSFLSTFTFATLALSVSPGLRAADTLPIFNATLTVGKDHRFILQSGGKTSPFLKIGESFDGYTVKAYDAKASALDLDHDGKTVRVTLASDATVENGTMASAESAHATIAEAQALMSKIHLDEMVDRSVAMQKKMIAASTANIGKNFPKADPTDVAAFQQKINDMVDGSLDPVKMKDDITKIYSDTFSSDELSQIGAFYDTPIGQTMLAKQPEVQQKMMTAMSQNAGQIGPKISQMARDFAVEQRAKMSAAAPAAPKP